MLKRTFLPATLLLLSAIFVLDISSTHEPFVGVIFLLINAAFAFYSANTRQTVIVSVFSAVILIVDAFHDWNPMIAGEFRKLDLSKRALELMTLGCLTVLITHSRQTREKLAERESRLRTLVESNPHCIKILDRDSRILEINATGLGLIGATRVEDVLGKRGLDLVVESHRTAVESLISGAFQRLSSQLDFEIDTLQGHRRWFQMSVVPLCDETKSKVVAALAISQDITDERDALQALRESELRLRLAMEAAAMETFEANYLHDVVKCSPGTAQLFGLETDQVVIPMEAFFAHIHPDDHEFLRTSIKNCQETGANYDGIVRVVGQNGSLRWVRGVGQVEMRNGRAYRMVGVVYDVTRPRQIQEALYSSEQKFRRLVENSYDGIAILDAQGLNTYWSPAAEKIFGRTQAEVLGTIFTTWVHPDDNARIQEDFGKLIAQPGGTISNVYRFQHKNETWLQIEALASNLLQDPSVQGIVANFRDITERLNSAAEARRHLAELAQMHRVTTVGQMVWELAHEINQPLYAINNFSSACEAILQSGRPDALEMTRGYVTQIHAQGERAWRIIARLRRFVRNDAPDRVPTPLGEIVHDVVDLVGNDPRIKGLEIHTQLPDNLPRVLVDKTQVEQVLVNLLVNAAEAMTDSQNGDRRISIQARDCDILLEVAVRDSGSGVSAEDLAQLCKPYFTTKSEGMGLGLAISRSIIEDHGGRLWAEANPSSGMTFRFTLPTATPSHRGNL